MILLKITNSTTRVNNVVFVANVTENGASEVTGKPQQATVNDLSQADCAYNPTHPPP
jgi:hypothetical protein